MKPKILALSIKVFVFALLLLPFSCSQNSDRNTVEIYVSLEGSDEADGSISSPLATLPVAVEKVRIIRESGNTDPAVIYLREGRHILNQTLVLGIEDGYTSSAEPAMLEEPGAGTSSGPAFLTFASYPGEEALVSSGVPVTGWEVLESGSTDLPAEAAGKVWVADIPEGLGKFYTLYDGQGRLNRARDAGFVPVKTGDKKTLYFPEGHLKNWDNLNDVEIQIRPSRAWIINMLPLESVDEATGMATTLTSATYEMGKLPGYLLEIMGESAASVWVENVLEELDEPGDWVVNTKTGKIYLWPSDPADDGSPRDILAPTLTELIRVEGKIDYDGPQDIPVRGIAFSGLTFTQCDRWAWVDDADRVGWGMQHDWDMFDRPTAMLRFRGAEDCQVTACKFLESGGSGLRLDLHAQRNRIENCEFAHLGEAGILLAGYGPGTKDVNHHNDIINNHIHHFSEITWHSPGVWAWQSGHNHIANNYIHHSGYCGVLITCRINPTRSRPGGEGSNTVRSSEISDEVRNSKTRGYENWQLREKYYHSRFNLLEYNEITYSVQKLSDGNGIYVSGAGRGNIVRYNYLHDNLEHHLPAPIRCDDDQHETLIYGNVIYNNYAFAAGIVSKGVNDIINNFIVAPLAVPRWGYISFEWVPVTGSKVYHNIIVSHPDGGKAQSARPRGEDTRNMPELETTKMDSNLFFNPANPDWVYEHLEKMQAVGNEQASLFADPMFVDPAGGNFTFKEGSPALKLGIEPLDVSKMGMLDPEAVISD